MREFKRGAAVYCTCTAEITLSFVIKCDIVLQVYHRGAVRGYERGATVQKSRIRSDSVGNIEHQRFLLNSKDSCVEGGAVT